MRIKVPVFGGFQELAVKSPDKLGLASWFTLLSSGGWTGELPRSLSRWIIILSCSFSSSLFFLQALFPKQQLIQGLAVFLLTFEPCCFLRNVIARNLPNFGLAHAQQGRNLRKKNVLKPVHLLRFSLHMNWEIPFFSSNGLQWCEIWSFIHGERTTIALKYKDAGAFQS